MVHALDKYLCIYLTGHIKTLQIILYSRKTVNNCMIILQKHQKGKKKKNCHNKINIANIAISLAGGGFGTGPTKSECTIY